MCFIDRDLSRFLFFKNVDIMLNICNYKIDTLESDMVKKIDIVYLWVDGSDANFIKLKNSCLSETGVVNSEHVESIAVNRWRDGGELKYSL
ncbi:MAG: Stealth CR1 domain-containing protein, partial [Alphaproteobacteria bacterium]